MTMGSRDRAARLSAVRQCLPTNSWHNCPPLPASNGTTTLTIAVPRAKRKTSFTSSHSLSSISTTSPPITPTFNIPDLEINSETDDNESDKDTAGGPSGSGGPSYDVQDSVVVLAVPPGGGMKPEDILLPALTLGSDLVGRGGGDGEDPGGGLSTRTGRLKRGSRGGGEGGGGGTGDPQRRISSENGTLGSLHVTGIRSGHLSMPAMDHLSVPDDVTFFVSLQTF